MTIKALLFDMDYTLLDRDLAVKTYARIQFERYASPQHIEPMVRHFHQRDLQGFQRRQEVFEEVASAFGYELPVDDLVTEFEAHAWEYAELFYGVDKMLEALRSRGFRLGVVTNGSARVQNLKVNSVGLRDMVDTIAIAGELDLWKPDPQVFEHVCIALSVDASECVFVGDTPLHDVVAAKNFGMTTVWCKAHHKWPDDTPVAYDSMVDHVTEILDVPGLLD